MTPAQRSKKPAKGKSTSGKSAASFTDEEKAAMREYAKERKAQAAGADGEKELLAKIAKMTGPDRSMAKRVHEVIRAAAPQLVPRTWYGMPAYAKDDKVVCFFQDAAKFKSRYATLGFSDRANLDEGDMWPSSFALKKLTPAEEARITALVKKAVG